MITDYQRYFDNIPTCPHCQTDLSCCEAPPIHIGDGLGWGSEILYICLNDDCSLFVRGWEQIDVKYGHRASYRYMQLPDSNESNVMMVASIDAYKGSVVDPEEIKSQNVRYHAEKEALEALDSCIETRDTTPVMHLILDEAAELEGRKKAVSMLGGLNDLTCIDPIRDHTFRDPALESEVNMAIRQLLRENYKKECPFCMEIIKSKAVVCMHCKKDV